MTKSIGIDIEKRQCVVCVLDEKGNKLKEQTYDNTLAVVKKFAKQLKRKYCSYQAACKYAESIWIKHLNQ